MTDKYIGIDPSLSGTGIIVLEGGDLSEKGALSAKTDQDMPQGRRYATASGQIAHQTRHMLRNLPRENSKHVHLEVGGWTQRQDAYIQGNIIRAIYSALEGIPNISTIREISPPTVKKYLTGDGSVSKRDMVLPAYKRFGVEFDTDDLLDAYGLAHLGWTADNYEESVRSRHGDDLPRFIKPQLVVVSDYVDEAVFAQVDERPWKGLKRGGRAWRNHRADALLTIQSARY